MSPQTIWELTASVQRLTIIILLAAILARMP